MKRKWFFRLLYAIAFFWLILLIGFYLIASNYRDYAIDYLKKYLDGQLTTEIIIERDNIHFGLLRKFPNISIRLDNVLVKSAPGPDYNHFQYSGKDTLLFAQRALFIFNIRSMFTKKPELKRIEVKNADLNILIDKNNKNNYDILRPSPQQKSEDSLVIDLKKIEFDNIKLCFIDASSQLSFNTFVTDGDLSGKFTKKNMEFVTSISGENATMDKNGKEYFRNEAFKFKSEITDNNDIYSFREGKLELFGIKMSFGGKWNNNTKKYSLFINSKSAPLHRIQFKAFKNTCNKISFYPQKGNLNFKININGASRKTPTINVHYEINNTILDSRKFDIKLKNIYAKGSYTNGKNAGALSSSIIIDSLSAISDESQFSFSGSLYNFNTPLVSGKFRGNLELEKICRLNNIQSRLEMEGIIQTYLNFEGTLPTLKSFKTSYLKNLTFTSQIIFDNIEVKPIINSLPAARASGKITFNNLRQVFLESIFLSTGNSKFIINGSVSNIPLVTENDALMPTYRCVVNSPEFHIEDFLLKSPSGKGKGKKVEFPDSIKIIASFNAENFYFGNFSANNVVGKVQYQPHTLKIDSFSMNSQEGKILSEIQITQQGDLFVAGCNANLNKLNITSLFKSFNNFAQTVISSENLAGTISGHVQVKEAWNQYLVPQYDMLNLEAEYEIVNGEIINYQPLLGLSRFIEVEELKHIRFQRLQSTVSIHNKTVYLSQTNINSSALNLKGSGEHLFDNSYEYHLQVQMADVLWNKAKKKKPQNYEFGYIVDDGLNRTTLPLVIKGKGTVYDVAYDKKAAVKSFKEKMQKEKEELKSLFSTDTENKPKELFIPEENIEWEETDKNPKEEQKTKETPTKKEKEEEFSIEWDDD